MSLPYFPYYAKDYQAKVMHLTLAEEGAYIRLLRLCWFSHDGTMPNDETWIFRKMIARAEDEKETIRTVLSEFFTVENDRIFNAKLCLVMLEQNDKHEARVKAGRKGGKTKSLKTKVSTSSKAKAKPKQPEPEPEPEPYIIKDIGDSGRDDMAIRALVIQTAMPLLNATSTVAMSAQPILNALDDPDCPCDFEKDVMPAIRDTVARGEPVNMFSLNYFAKVAITYRDKRLAGNPKPQTPKAENGKQCNSTSTHDRINASRASDRDEWGEVLGERENDGFPETVREPARLCGGT